jgi:hypothetical protein
VAESKGRTHAKKKDDDVLPAIYEHCCATYKEMLSEARPVASISSGKEEAPKVIVYEGFLTNLVTQKLHLSVPYYGRIRTLLIDMGCVRQLKRGGGTAPSQWEMITEPQVETFLKVYAPDKPQTGSKLSKTNDRVSYLEEQVGKLRSELDNIKLFLADQFGTETEET